MEEVAGPEEDPWMCVSQSALRRTTDLTCRALKAAGVLLSSFDGDVQTIRSASGLRPKVDTISASESLCGETRTLDALLRKSSDVPLRSNAFEVPIRSYIGAPLRLTSGRVIGVLCAVDHMLHDWSEDDVALVTELAACLANEIELQIEIRLRGKAETALRESQARLLAVADHIPGIVFERRKTGAARSIYTFFGSQKTSLPAVRDMMLLGESGTFQFVHRDDRECVRSALLRSTLEETDLDLTFRVKDLDGSIRWLRSQSIVRRDLDDTAVWDGLCFDITNLIVAREEAEAARAEKEAAFVNVNHELRTPLQTIIGFTEFLKFEQRPDLIDAHAKNIQTAAATLLSIVNSTLDRAHSEAVFEAPVSESVDLRAMAEGCLRMVESLASQRRLVLHLDVRADVPKCAAFERPKVQQALLNLLSNAAKFTDEGSITLSIAAFGDRLRFSVTDTGIGIPVEKRAAIFERFSRLQTGGRTAQGNGLGLAITRELVEELGGTIEIADNEGQGTVFWFEIPHVAAAAPIPSVEPAMRSHQPSGALRILVADDLDLNRKLIADMLAIDDHVVDCVADGRAAVQAASEQTYDLILMDMIMPGMDGLAATKAIRALPLPARSVPIIALTAHSFRDQLDKCLQAGMNATLTKPMSLEALSNAVTSWARGKKAA